MWVLCACLSAIFYQGVLMRIMALDIGVRRIGVAMSDALRMTAQGLEVITRAGNRKDFDRLAQLLTEYEVSEIVLGYPKNMNGTVGEKCAEVEHYASLLAERFPDVKIHFWDERLSTMEAQKVLIGADVRRDKRKNVVDKMAAVIILQGFLQRFG